jgi:hypothetical protein
MTTEHCWNDTERTKPKCLLAEKYTLVPQNTQTYHEISFVPLPIRRVSTAIKEIQPPDSLSRFACLYLRVSSDSKWWNSNLIINWALLILFVLFPIVEIYRLLKVWVRRRNCIHHSLRQHVHNLSHPEYETDFFPRKTHKFPNLSPL